MNAMRSSLVLLRVLAALGGLSALSASTGCATSMGSASGDGRVVVAVDTPSQSSSERSEVVQVTEVVQPVAPAAPAGRRRLSETVTLGQGTTEPLYVPGQQGQVQQASTANGVVVNNNITVVNGQQPGYGYGGYYGDYGYGGYGGFGRGSGALGTGRDSRGAAGAGMPANGAWAPSGWEGAQRTAAPGHTPGVGGNWAPPPSFGPRSQR
jgi:hypothetical protein